jgi:hypothetical protein
MDLNKDVLVQLNIHVVEYTTSVRLKIGEIRE